MRQASGTVDCFDEVSQIGAIRPHGQGLPAMVLFHWNAVRRVTINGGKKTNFLPARKPPQVPQAGEVVIFLLPEDWKELTEVWTKRVGLLPQRPATAPSRVEGSSSGVRGSKQKRNRVDRHLQLRNNHH